ncbi:MAG: hypothetical protein Q8P13_04050 [bacterium]|nr:hypothetical protein [bacterium]
MLDDKVGETFAFDLDCTRDWYPVGDITEDEAWNLANSAAPHSQWNDEEITAFIGYQYATGKRDWPEEIALVVTVDEQFAHAVVRWEGNYYRLRRKVEPVAV